MITPSEFAKQWNEPLAKLNQPFVLETNISQATLDFLCDAGLPFDCAPYLSFGTFTEGLKPVDIVYNMGREHFTPQEKIRLDSYLMIGSDGEGSPICLDKAQSERVVILDHDDNFQTVAFVNSTVPHLAECLLIYRNLINVSLSENGEEAWLDGNIPTHAIQEAINQIRQADPDALNDDSFWRSEIDTISRDA